jgi:hypothetical protein
MTKVRPVRRGLLKAARAREPLRVLKPLGATNCKLCGEKIDEPHAGISARELGARQRGYHSAECEDADE